MDAIPQRQERKERQGPARGGTGATRRLLLDTAAGLMTERATTAITLADIAERSGMNAALVKYHFGSKGGLLIALAEDICAEAMEKLADVVRSERPPLEKLEIHIAAFIRFYARYPFLSQLLHELQASADETLRRAASACFLEPLLVHETALLREAEAAGVIRPTDPKFFLFSVVGACHYLFSNRTVLRETFGMTRIDEPLKAGFIAHTASLILSGLKTRRE